MDAGQTDRHKAGTKPSISLALPLSPCNLQSNETRLWIILCYSITVQLVSPRMKMQKPSLFSWGAFCVPSWSQCAPRWLPRSSGHSRSITETTPLLPAGSSFKRRVVRFLLGHARLGLLKEDLPASNCNSIAQQSWSLKPF